MRWIDFGHEQEQKANEMETNWKKTDQSLRNVLKDNARLKGEQRFLYEKLHAYEKELQNLQVLSKINCSFA